MYPDYSSSSSSADTDEQQQSPKKQGLLADFTPLADFKVERQYGKFSEQDGCAYAVKVRRPGAATCVNVAVFRKYDDV
jgi:hypothetical protein